MQYTKTLTTKTGSELYLRNGDAPDGDAALAVFNKTHAETEYLLTYPDESSMTAEQEAEFLAQATKRAREIEILAFVDGQLAGTAGISAVGKPCKLAHRAEFGIGILQAYWGQGIGYALTAACIDCARQAGYLQLELDVVADNARAIALYKKLGFVEYGRNPRGFRKRNGDYQELVYMRVELVSRGRACKAPPAIALLGHLPTLWGGFLSCGRAKNDAAGGAAPSASRQCMPAARSFLFLLCKEGTEEIINY